jgi:hypothetical protein
MFNKSKQGEMSPDVACCRTEMIGCLIQTVKAVKFYLSKREEEEVFLLSC